MHEVRACREERQNRHDEPGQPCATTGARPSPLMKSPNVERELDEKDRPEDGEHDQHGAHHHLVALTCDQVPLRDDDVGQEQEVNRERRPVEGTGEQPLQRVGVSCHSIDVPTAVEVISSWQLWFAPTSTRLVAGTVCGPQLSDWRVGSEVARIHVPGPWSGTSTTPNCGDNVPASTPLEGLTLGADATDFTVELVLLT
jgi:hypothetical protein